MGKSREHWYERVETKKVTKDWIKLNCKLTEREKELLPIIYERKLVRRDHLEIISPTYRKLGKNRTSLLNRAIKKLFKAMIFDKVHERQEIGKGCNPSTVSIDRAGSLILGVPHKKRIIHRSTSLKGKEYISRSLPANFRHINGVNQLEVDTILFCEENNYEIVEWKLEQPKSFQFNDEKIVLIPDVLVVLKVNGHNLAFFIEYDTGSEGLREPEPKIIKDKILKYKRYKSSQIWMAEEWQKHFSQSIFPFLLFVSEQEDKRRVDFFNRISKEYKVKGLGMYSENYSSVLDKLIGTLNKNTPHTR